MGRGHPPSAVPESRQDAPGSTSSAGPVAFPAETPTSRQGSGPTITGMEYRDDEFWMALAAMGFDNDVALKVLDALIDDDATTARNLIDEPLKDSDRASNLMGTFANLAAELALKLADGDREVAKRLVAGLIRGEIR
jgi:hypothetical protein